jgi:uncharacterized protein (TIGR03067 family)
MLLLSGAVFGFGLYLFFVYKETPDLGAGTVAKGPQKNDDSRFANPKSDTKKSEKTDSPYKVRSPKDNRGTDEEKNSVPKTKPDLGEKAEGQKAEVPPAVKETIKPAQKEEVPPVVKEPPPPASKKDESPTTAIDEGMKKLQGQWMFEKGERNGAGRFSLPEDCMYIERNVLQQVKKNGELIFNGSRCEFTIDPTKNPMTIDLVRQNGSPGAKILGIYKFDDDKLIIATNTNDSDARPGEFSSNLTAGKDRATNLQTYKLVKGDPVEKPAAKKEKLTEEQIAAANAGTLEKLQGQWIFEKAERNGSSYWVLPEESIYIERNLLRHVKKNGDIIFNGSACEFTIDATKPYMTIDLVRKNGNPGQKVFGIFKIEGDRLIIASNTADDNKELRPAQFSVKLTAGLERASIVQTYKLVKGDPVEKPATKKEKLTEEQIAAANAETLKKLQGQWIFEKAERNGSSYWVLPEESIYIEKNLLRHVKKNGDTIFNGSACEFTIDATKPYMTIDLVRKNGNPGQKIFGIFKIEGDRLIIATNTAEDNQDIRPGQFSVRLTAGQERAAVVQTYKRATKN